MFRAQTIIQQLQRRLSSLCVQRSIKTPTAEKIQRLSLFSMQTRSRLQRRFECLSIVSKQLRTRLKTRYRIFDVLSGQTRKPTAEDMQRLGVFSMQEETGDIEFRRFQRPDKKPTAEGIQRLGRFSVQARSRLQRTLSFSASSVGRQAVNCRRYSASACSEHSQEGYCKGDTWSCLMGRQEAGEREDSVLAGLTWQCFSECGTVSCS